MAAHRYWRINVLSNEAGNTGCVVGEITLATSAGGPNLALGCTYSASNPGSGPDDPSSAFGTSGAWTSDGSALPQWLACDFGDGVAYDIVETTMQCWWADPTLAPATFNLEWSDDAVAWTIAQNFVAATWVPYAKQVFPPPPAPLVPTSYAFIF